MLQQKELFQENGFVLSFKTSFILPVMLLSTQDNYFFPSAAVMLGLTVFLLSRGNSASLEFHGFRWNKIQNTMRFDIVVSFDAEDRKAIYAEMVSDVQKALPDIQLQVALDTDFAEE